MTEVRNKNDFNEYIESLLVNYESDERAPLKFRWSSYFCYDSSSCLAEDALGALWGGLAVG